MYGCLIWRERKKKTKLNWTVRCGAGLEIRPRILEYRLPLLRWYRLGWLRCCLWLGLIDLCELIA